MLNRLRLRFPNRVLIWKFVLLDFCIKKVLWFEIREIPHGPSLSRCPKNWQMFCSCTPRRDMFRKSFGDLFLEIFWTIFWKFLYFVFGNFCIFCWKFLDFLLEIFGFFFGNFWIFFWKFLDNFGFFFGNCQQGFVGHFGFFGKFWTFFGKFFVFFGFLIWRIIVRLLETQVL